MRAAYFVMILAVLLAGCGQPSLDECTDSKAHLWNKNIKDNTYKSNERYWDAITECQDKH